MSDDSKISRSVGEAFIHRLDVSLITVTRLKDGPEREAAIEAIDGIIETLLTKPCGQTPTNQKWLRTHILEIVRQWLQSEGGVMETPNYEPVDPDSDAAGSSPIARPLDVVSV